MRRYLILLVIPLLFISAARRSQVYPVCAYSPLTDQLRTQLRIEDWTGFIADLSGERPVEIDGVERTILTRNSYAMGLRQQNALAVEYVVQTLEQWYPLEQIEIDFYSAYTPDGYKDWKNVVLTIPGMTRPMQSVLMTAHLDSRNHIREDKILPAPGADDNASGAAALLEAARVFRDQAFDRMVRLIWFTGEELGMWGSHAYVNDHNLAGVVGVFNMDMFSYDGDGDRCFELHVGTLAASQPVGQCFTDTLAAYPQDLKLDYITDRPSHLSDHSAFWNKGVGAVLVLENVYSNTLPGGCTGTDSNPNYHTTDDTLANMHPEFGFSIASTAILAVHRMAGPPWVITDILYFPAVFQ